MAPKAAESTKDTTTATATAENPEQQQTQPQTAAEIAATEQALGLTPPAPAAADTKKATQTLPAKVPVRMGVAPTNIEEGWRLAQFIAQSELVPKGYRGRPADVLVAIQYGMEVGLPPMAALHSIYVTNGRPSLWGDGFLAVIMASPRYKDHAEYYIVDGNEKEFLVASDLAKDDTMAVTTFWRTDSARPRTATFSIAKAKKAGLWTKAGPWQEYPDRMLKYRARGFAGHDAFPDVLRGITMVEIARDEPPIDVEPEPAREVKRLSETKSADAAVPATSAPVHVQKVEEVTLDAASVVDVAQFMGGFSIKLSNGITVDTTEVADAVELEKGKGTKYKFRLTCARADDGNLQLKSYVIAD